MKKTVTLALLLIAALCLAVIAFPLIANRAGGQSRRSGPDGTEAALACQGFVLERLKAPKTAEFQNAAAASAREHGVKMWVVESYVDAQNSFGALIRTHYTCRVRYRSSEDTWRLDELTLEE